MPLLTAVYILPVKVSVVGGKRNITAGGTAFPAIAERRVAGNAAVEYGQSRKHREVAHDGQYSLWGMGSQGARQAHGSPSAA